MYSFWHVIQYLDWTIDKRHVSDFNYLISFEHSTPTNRFDKFMSAMNENWNYEYVWIRVHISQLFLIDWISERNFPLIWETERQMIERQTSQKELNRTSESVLWYIYVRPVVVFQCFAIRLHSKSLKWCWAHTFLKAT